MQAQDAAASTSASASTAAAAMPMSASGNPANGYDNAQSSNSDKPAPSSSSNEELPFLAPLSHKPFLADNDASGEGFSASSFLLTRKHTSLDDLRSELRTYLSSLRVQLVGIINVDYEDFINLGGSHLLGSEDQMSLRMRRPLEGSAREVAECRQELHEMREALRRKMKVRETIRQRKVVCRKLLAVDEQVAKVEEMLLIPPPPLASTSTLPAIATAAGEVNGANRQFQKGHAASASLAPRVQTRRVSPAMKQKVDRSMGSDTKRLERVAQEYNQLLYLVRKSQGLAFVQHLQPRIDRISTTLQQDLSSLLTSTLTSMHQSHTSHAALSSNASKSNHISDYKSKLEALQDLFRTYASIHKLREAEEVVRKNLVVDFMSRTIHREALLGPQSPMMPITPFSGGGPSSLFGSFGASMAQASTPSANTASSPASGGGGAYPFPSAASTSASGSGTTLSNEERTLIPPFYVVDPVAAPPAPSNSDTYVSDALVELYNKLLTFISKDLAVVLDIAERKSASGRAGTTVASAPQAGDSLAASMYSEAPGQTAPSSPTPKERNLYNPTSSSAAAAASNTASVGLSNKPGFEILANVVWDEIANRLMNECSHLIFAAGRPDTFHRNYLTTLSFVSRLESLCPSLRYLQIFRNNPTFIAFTKRWQLPVYFQLRFKEIVGHLESSLAVHTIVAAPSAVQSTSLIMAATEQIYKAAALCWHDDIYLADLSGRFWKLTLQIISRYKTWLDAHLPEYVVKEAAAAPALQSGAATASGAGVNLTKLLPSASLFGGSAASRPSTPQPPSNNSDDAADEGTLRQLPIVVADTLKLETLLRRMYEHTISPKLPKLSGPSVLAVEGEEETPEAALEASLQSLTSLLPSLLAQLAVILSKRCSEPLRLVRSGASQVRANTGKSAKDAKPEPSYFVSNILRPAKAFLDGPGKVLNEDMRRSTMQTLFEDLAVRYEAALSKMKKDGDALKRLKKGRQGFQLFGRSSSAASSANEDAVSAEDEKVRLQMQTDIEAFAKDAQALGVRLEESAALKELRTLVEDWNK